MVTPAQVDSRFRLGAATAAHLATTFGTPLFVIDEQHFRNQIRAYRTAFTNAYADSEISFASKANSTLAVIAIAYSEGCTIDVASEGELRAAIAAGVPASNCHLHGNNKSESELEFALIQGVGHVVADHFGEIEMLREFSANRGLRAKVVLRLAPGVDPITHAKISTGQADTKFGFNIEDGSAITATRACLDAGLDLIGFHCHVGSQLLDPEAQRAGGELIAQFALRAYAELSFEARYLNIGGGLGIAYTHSESAPDLKTYNEMVVDALVGALAGNPLHPRLAQEPGRSLIAQSGLTLYRVGVVKSVPAKSGRRTYVSVDGGLSDNPRPALYGSQYMVERVWPENVRTDSSTVTVSGKHCETDMLFPDVALPDDIGANDILQVLCTGAYNASMASNYNRFPRPATVLIRINGDAELVQRRDSWDEMFARELVPEGLICDVR